MPLIMTLHLFPTNVDPETGLVHVAATIELSALDALLQLEDETATLNPVPGEYGKIGIAFEGATRLASLRLPPEKEKREEVLSPCYDMLQAVDRHIQNYAEYLSRGE
ncbi:hypothetical protein J8F10_09120 [Gemmata sp. G18]|uniref:Uncharacterized protein n=1 Tax=Gemmata palustris TaxID=2822762 RepID=A0ABS5BNY8_9BACT|nr:hypothetical protein [Gemmata palustris]MBP3955441.1 hypothetical protein [Gemmata palustris]